MLGISGTELVIILFFGFLIFGPEKLPQMGRTVGRAIRQFRQASDSMNQKFKEEVADPFQEAVAPIKESIESVNDIPIKDDIDAINKNIQETKQVFTDPFKDAFESGGKAKDEKPAPKGAVVAAGSTTACTDPNLGPKADNDDPFAGVTSSSNKKPETASASSGSAPFAGVADSAGKPSGEAQPIPEPSAKKKSIAASLYDLDDDSKDGE